jgi:hypothetical protein
MKQYGFHLSGRFFTGRGYHEHVLKPMHRRADDTVKKITVTYLPEDDWEYIECEIGEGAPDG